MFGLLVAKSSWPMMGVGFGLATAAAAEVVGARSGIRRACASVLAGLGVFVLAPALAAGVGAITTRAGERAQGLDRTGRSAFSGRRRGLLASSRPIGGIRCSCSMGNSGGFQPAAQWIASPASTAVRCRNSLYMGASVVALALAAFGRPALSGFCAGVLGGRRGHAGAGQIPACARAVFRLVVFPFAHMRFPEKVHGRAGRLAGLLAALGTAGILAAERSRGGGGRLAWSVCLCFAISHASLSGGWAAQVTWALLPGSGCGRGLAVQVLAARRLRPCPSPWSSWLWASTWRGHLAATGFRLPAGLPAASAPAARAVLADSPGHGERRDLPRQQFVEERGRLCPGTSARIGRTAADANLHYRYRQLPGALPLCPGTDAAIRRRSIASGNPGGRGTVGAALARGALRPSARGRSAGPQREAHGNLAHCSIPCRAAALPCTRHFCRGSLWSGRPRSLTMRWCCAGSLTQPSLPAARPGSPLIRVLSRCSVRPIHLRAPARWILCPQSPAGDVRFRHRRLAVLVDSMRRDGAPISTANPAHPQGESHYARCGSATR